MRSLGVVVPPGLPQNRRTHRRTQVARARRLEFFDAVNARFQADIVKDILVEIFNFVPKDSIRVNSLGRPEE